MTKKPALLPPAEADLFGQPVTKMARAPKVAPQGRNVGKPETAKALQPFLPGLSRRGRPRKKNPIPPVVRATESRKRRIDAGVKRIEILLEPEVVALLETLQEERRLTRVELLSDLIRKAARQALRRAASKGRE